jgi:hypothetical protein
MVLKWITIWISLILLLGTTAPGFQGGGTALAGVSAISLNFLPITWKTNPWRSSFGVEITTNIFAGDPTLYWAARMPAKWVRLNQRISWRALQPNAADPIQWNLLANFENELRLVRGANMTPIVVVDDYPAWATTTRPNGDPSYCGPLRSDKYSAFATFVSQLVVHFKTPEFNVHVWELGNEPDVDGDYFELPLDSQYGCWGIVTDRYYGGQAYGEMLKIVTPAIKAADPSAQVWIGGLLLDRPFTQDIDDGRPELFLQGILVAGLGTNYAYFDVVPYHAYTTYNRKEPDYDTADSRSPWVIDPQWGGIIRGKAKFLRQLMSAYGVQKPLFINEISLTCPEEWFTFCNPPEEAFYQAQANHLVRAQVRGLSVGLMGFTWYTLNGPSWRNGGLLDAPGNPLPSFLAYQELAQQLINADYVDTVDYGADFEAYIFRRGTQEVHVVWSQLDVAGLTILVPADKYIEARRRDGTLIAPVLVDGNYQIPVGYSPIYVIRTP